jgi:transcription elongation GreA/GreB family factor
MKAWPHVSSLPAKGKDFEQRQRKSELHSGWRSGCIGGLLTMNKRALVKKIIADLEGKLALYAKAARTARDEATDDESKAEDKYDTRGLEASYLARGQSMHAAETEQALEQFQRLAVRAFKPKDPIDIGALVELEGKDGRTFYFIGSCAGGTEIVHEKKEVLVITPQSPLGQQLAGKKQGDRLKIKLGRLPDDYRVVSVS